MPDDGERPPPAPGPRAAAGSPSSPPLARVDDAATSASRVSSTEWKARWNGTNRASDAQPAHRRHPGRGLLGPVLEPRQPVRRPGDVHGVVERLVHQHEHGEQRPEGGPAAERVEAAVGPHARAPAGSRLSATVWPSLSRKKPVGENVCRQRATSPSQQSQQHLQLAEQRGEHGADQAGDQQGAAGRGTGDDHQHGDAVGGDRRAEQDPGEVRREAPLVEVARSSARSCAGPVTDGGWVTARSSAMVGRSATCGSFVGRRRSCAGPHLAQHAGPARPRGRACRGPRRAPTGPPRRPRRRATDQHRHDEQPARPRRGRAPGRPRAGGCSPLSTRYRSS